MNVIAFTETDGQYDWLSNASAHSIRWNGSTYKTAEHLFQSMRFDGMPGVQKEICEQASPLTAKSVAKKYRGLLASPIENDLLLMRRVVRFKLIYNPDLIRRLIGTEGDIIEDSSNRKAGTGLLWGAAKQADGTWDGENHLGRIWMELRDELKRILLI